MERLKVLDAQFLHMEDERTPMHIACVCTFDGPAPTREETGRLMMAKLALIPRYRKRVRFLPLEIGRPVWVDDVHFDLGYHVRRTALPEPGDDGALCALMGRLVSQTLDRERPLWELWIVEGLAQGRWALISKIHHSMVDGISGVDLLTTVLDDAPDRPLPAEVEWTPEPEPSRLAMVLDAWRGLARDAGDVASAVAEGVRQPSRGARELRDRAVGLAAFTRRIATLRSGSIQGTIGKHRVFAHATVDLADVLGIRKALGGTVNDVVLAVISGGYRMLLAQRGEDPDRARVRSLVPVSVRAPEARGVMDNRVSAVLCDLPVQVADPVDRLNAVRAEMDRLKVSHMAEAGALVIELGDLAPPFVLGPTTRMVMRAMHRAPQRFLATVTTNVPGPRQPLYFAGRRMVDWFPYVPIGQGLRVGTAILSYAGRIEFGITSDYDTVPDATVLARAIEDGVRELGQAATTRRSA
jgi:diacylglycerol O-acyltransferase